MSDIDLDLKRVFDERLGPLAPPARKARPGRSRARLAAAAALAAVLIAATTVALDINTTAAANGVDCADVMAKLRVWSQAHFADLPVYDHVAARQELAKIVAESGCAIHDKGHDSGSGSAPKHTAGH